MAVAIAAGVIFYLGFLAVIIWLSVRWSRKNLQKKNDALMSGLAGEAKPLGEVKKPTLYSGSETEYEIGGRRVRVNAHYQNRSWIRVSVKIAGGPYPWVTIFPEGKVERFGKAIGLNREVQSGDKAFDDLAYLDTIDTEENVRRVVEPAGVRGAVSELLQLGYKVQLSRDGVEAFQLLRGYDQIDGTKTAPVVAALGRLADALPIFPGVGLENPRSPRRVAFAMMLVFSWLFAFLAIGLASGNVNRTVDKGSSMLVIFGGGALLWALYVAALAAGVRGRSYAMRTVLVGGFVGVLGIPAGGGFLVHWLNQAFDKSEATVFERVVLEHKRLKGDCRLTVDALHGTGVQSLYVKHKGGDEVLPKGSAVTVRTHPGAFGLEWYEAIAP